MATYPLTEAAQRAGIDVGELSRLVELGIITPSDGDQFTNGAIRRGGMVRSLVAAGIPLDGLSEAIRGGQVSLDFLDAPAFERFTAVSDHSFAQFAKQAEVPVELLMLIREAAGSPSPLPSDRIRDEELPYPEFIGAQYRAGFPPAATERLLRVQGDSFRRMAETESAWWDSEVIRPAIAGGKRPDQASNPEFGDQMTVLSERAMMGMYHLRQAQAWSARILTGLESMLAAAGLHQRLEHPPAMCFLDITGYTQPTQERGDAAAARRGHAVLPEPVVAALEISGAVRLHAAASGL